MCINYRSEVALPLSVNSLNVVRGLFSIKKGQSAVITNQFQTVRATAVERWRRRRPEEQRGGPASRVDSGLDWRHRPRTSPRRRFSSDGPRCSPRGPRSSSTSRRSPAACRRSGPSASRSTAALSEAVSAAIRAGRSPRGTAVTSVETSSRHISTPADRAMK